MKKIEKKLYIKLLLISLWISFFLSINLNPIEFLQYNLIDQARLVTPFFLAIFLISFKWKEIKISNFLNLYSFLFYFIFLLYIIFTLTSENSNINIFWPLYMLLSFFTLHNLTTAEDKKHLLILTIIIIALGFIFYFSTGLLEMYNKSKFHFYGIMGAELSYFGLSNPPRSSGLARFALILFSFFTYYYLIKEKNKNYILLIIICIFATLSLIFQSRTISFIYFMLIAYIILFYFTKFFKDKLLIVFSLILPLLINFSYNLNLISKQDEIQSTSNLEFCCYNKQIVITALQNVVTRDHLYHRKKPDRFGSGRFENWKVAHKIIKKNFLIGYGAQADRLLVEQSIHNSLLYSILAGGLLAGLSLIMIYILSILLLIKFYFSNIYRLSNNPLSHFAGSLLIILGLRSVLETSFAVFSIDFLIFIIAFIFFNNYLKKYQ